MADFAERIGAYRERVEAALDRLLPSADHEPAALHEAMRYALLGGGKRIRPLLAYAAAEALEVDPDRVTAAACAVECVHSYSLVHDDLPAMDDDDLRHGKPTVHKVWDDAMAVLVGDALQSLAFQSLAADSAAPVAAWVARLAEAAGAGGMVGGQQLDLEGEKTTLDLDGLKLMHEKKTGALIHAAVMFATDIEAAATPAQADALDRFARGIGLAFQVRDDVIDVTSTTEELGKPQGSDAEQGKSTFVTLLGLNAAQSYAADVFGEAVAALDPLGGSADGLRHMGRLIVERTS